MDMCEESGYDMLVCAPYCNGVEKEVFSLYSRSGGIHMISGGSMKEALRVISLRRILLLI